MIQKERVALLRMLGRLGVVAWSRKMIVHVRDPGPKLSKVRERQTSEHRRRCAQRSVLCAVPQNGHILSMITAGAKIDQ